MTSSRTTFNATTLVAAAAEVLEEAGFKQVAKSAALDWQATVSRVYEDPYCVVGVAIYETWEDLWRLWAEDQAQLVRLISDHIVETDAKAWDGYIVLLTPSIVQTNERQDADDIQRNTFHLRKLFADGDQLRTVSDIRDTLLPLLPLDVDVAVEPVDALGSLPSLLGRRGVDAKAAQVAVDAFRERRPIVEAIHSLLSQNERNQS